MAARRLSPLKSPLDANFAILEKALARVAGERGLLC
jgi:hypothetical protein